MFKLPIESQAVTRAWVNPAPVRGFKEICSIPTYRHSDDTVLGASRRMVSLILKRDSVR